MKLGARERDTARLPANADVRPMYLERDGFRVIPAYDGAQALDLAARHRPQFVVLDLMLPRVDGITVCREIQKASRVPTLMLTAKVEETNKLVGPRKWLAYGLGGLWILDGLLQAQPLMFTHFLDGVVVPLLHEQPAPIAWAMRLGIRLWSLNPVLWNALASLLQLGIGVLILFGGETALRRTGLWVSVGWGLVIWVGGEGLGSLFAGGTWLGGTPGSILLYMLAAWLLLLPPALWETDTVPRLMSRGIAGVWWLAALEQAWPPNGWWTAHGLADHVTAMAQMPQPAIVAAPLFAWAALLHAHPEVWNALLITVMVGLAAAWTVRPRARWLWWMTTVWTVATWWVGQDWECSAAWGPTRIAGRSSCWA